jgi:hypothetical protein
MTKHGGFQACASTLDLSAQDEAKVTIGFLESHKKYSSRNSGWKEPVR